MDETPIIFSPRTGTFTEVESPVQPAPKAIPTWLAIIRWISFLPLAVLGGSLVALAARAINYATMVMYMGLEPESYQIKIFKNIVANLLLGAAVVYIGAKIAPYHRRTVAYGMALITIMLGGLSLFPAIMDRDWWALVGCIVMAIGAGSVAHGVATGELDIDTHKF